MEQRASRSRHNCLLTSYHHHLHPNSARTRPLDAPVHKKKVSTSNIFFTCYSVFFHFFLLFPPLSPLFLSPTCVPLRETRGGCLWEPGDSCAKRAESLGIFSFSFSAPLVSPCAKRAGDTCGSLGILARNARSLWEFSLFSFFGGGFFSLAFACAVARKFFVTLLAAQHTCSSIFRII